MPLLPRHERPPRTLHASPSPAAASRTPQTNTHGSKWFMLALGPTQLHKMLDGFDDKRATAVCTFAYCEGPGQTPMLFQGKTEGKLVASRGPTVFGELMMVLSRVLSIGRTVAILMVTQGGTRASSTRDGRMRRWIKARRTRSRIAGKRSTS